MYFVHDKFAKRAKQEGFRARSAYKLLDIQQKYRVMKPGDAVLDLGCSPGSWVQTAAKSVEQNGKVIGIDIEPIQNIEGANIEVFQRDVFDSDFEETILRKSGRKFNVLLSDMAPSTSGIKEHDQERAHELSLRAFLVARTVLKAKGNAVIKIFQGPATPQLIKEMKERFSSVVMVKPMASQKRSKEWYIVARDFRG